MTRIRVTQWDSLSEHVNLRDETALTFQEKVTISRGKGGRPSMFTKKDSFKHVGACEWPTSATSVFYGFVQDLPKAKIYENLGVIVTDNNKLPQYPNLYLSYLSQESLLSTNNNIFVMEKSTAETGLVRRINPSELANSMRNKFLNMKKAIKKKDTQDNTNIWDEMEQYVFEFSSFSPGECVFVLYMFGIMLHTNANLQYFNHICYFNCLMWASIRSHTFVRSTTLR